MNSPTAVLIAIAAGACALAWAIVIKRHLRGVPLVPFSPRRPVPWTILDLLFVAGFFLAFLALEAILLMFVFAGKLADSGGEAQRRASEVLDPGDLAISLAAGLAANVATCGFAAWWLSLRPGVALEDLGWRRDKIRDDLRLGFIAFLAVAPPIYGLQALLSQLVKEQHPIIEVLLQHPSPLLYALAGLSAVAVAPLAEEFFFRALLQGWLESISLSPDSPPEELPVAREPRPQPVAIIVSSLVFASLHIGHGAAPIPLFFLALALGYLYQRTHRLLPCVTVHFCLNACSFAMLCMMPPAAG